MPSVTPSASTIPTNATVVDTGDRAFSERHIGPGHGDVARMAAALGYDNVEALLDTALPPAIRMQGDLDLPAALSEPEALAQLRSFANANTVNRSMIGQGYYGTHTPGVVKRNVLESPSWYTAYTPYQPEISQGRLEALLNFQTMVCDLTGLVMANSSMLDEGTAAAEAMTLMRRQSKAAKDAVFLVDQDIFAQTLAVVKTRAEALGIQVRTADLSAGLPEGDVFGVLVQYPGASGVVRNLEALVAQAHDRGALITAAADLLALTVLKSPGEMGVDVCVGSTQRFGVPMGFGGPHAGYMSVRAGLERSLPGRLVGMSVDAEGVPAYRLALQTREQHIRREKATSNICTAQVLLAVMASMYAVYHGPQGLKQIAVRTHEHACDLAARLSSVDGLSLVHDAFFDTIVVNAPGKAESLVASARNHGVLLHLIDADHLSISCDETTTDDDITTVVLALGGGEKSTQSTTTSALPQDLVRQSDYLTHPVFSSYHNEHAMLRYLRKLADLDYALDRGMIPLGSCTMKLNATTEMESITWPEFSNLHPYAPQEDTRGSRELAAQLEAWLCAITGYDAVSLQPNAGSQGELAGLLAIRAYHRDNGDHQRTICLIPLSAHGTNAASAVMAGLQVVTVKTAATGDIDMDDLRAKVDQHRDNLACIMVTYPSTHGVYEQGITQLCELIHEAGGQVYVDGANLNALVGLAQPGAFGSDVSHLNLHKTFTIPHGGGGPGVGPVAVRGHLAKYLPATHPSTSGPVGMVSAAPYGSAGILPISWTYIALMGSKGLREATAAAVVSANYVAHRLKNHYPVLFTGEGGLVAHECILDLRPMTKQTGVTVDDVAKRLMDYGFHAPTMSFPVAGTLMVEPTESEDMAELDRFCDAMIRIREEAAKVESGEWPKDDNPLCNAPHTAQSMAGEWNHPYTRSEACFPAGVDPKAKYWPPVRRIDGAYGDRHLVCSCPPVEDLAQD